MNFNFQKDMDKLILSLIESNNIPTLLLHSCCAPCSSYVIEYLSQYFKITVMYYNPNISFDNEYAHRLEEQKRLVQQMVTKNPVTVVDGEYKPDDFFEVCKGYEREKEGGKRCEKCFNLRLEYCAKYAKEHNFDYFATTLTISPLKNAELINQIGLLLSEKYAVKYLCSDFKKKNGYKRSLELSRHFNLYRQNYCGCVYSKNERELAQQ